MNKIFDIFSLFLCLACSLFYEDLIQSLNFKNFNFWISVWRVISCSDLIKSHMCLPNYGLHAKVRIVTISCVEMRVQLPCIASAIAGGNRSMIFFPILPWHIFEENPNLVGLLEPSTQYSDNNHIIFQLHVIVFPSEQHCCPSKYISYKTPIRQI